MTSRTHAVASMTHLEPARAPEHGTLIAFIGSRTTRERNARGDGITVCAVDEASGALRPLQVLGGLVNPSYLAMAADGRTLHAVHGDGHTASALRIDAGSGRLSLLATQEIGGRNPVHLVHTRDGRHLLVTDHLGASIAVLPVADDGRLQPPAQRLPITGTPGPHRIEQPHAKPHYAGFSACGRWLLVPDKGLDRVFVRRWDGQRLIEDSGSAMVAREGAGPRHLAVHPHAPWVWIVNELDSTVTTAHLDGETGTLQPLETRSTLSPRHTGHSRAAAIQVAADGRTVYTSNRGEDSIAVFAVDPADGSLTLRQTVASGGRTPRFITPGPDGRWLYALNEDSDTVTTFAVDPEDGTLTPTGRPLSCGSPVCLVFHRLPA
ncbi:MAG: hypothetical protein RIQ53_4478 [Pseudomonadota bacterium]